MKKIPLGSSGMEVPAVAVGCMRINGMEPQALPPTFPSASKTD